MNTLEFYRHRFRFRALDTLHFPPGKSGNTIRGAFGALLRQTADADAYRRIFEPGHDLGRTPSGLADWPRPFLFRAAHLDGLTIPQGGAFHIDMHLFDTSPPWTELLRTAFQQLAAQGLGPGRGRAELEGIDQLDLQDRLSPSPCTVELHPEPEPVAAVRLRFLTPTELKSEGGLAHQPDFPVLFARLRDRLSTLRTLYGAGPLAVDFRALGERAAAIRLARCDVSWERVERKSSRTGQTHWLGGFTGQAEYTGELAEFLPWLRAARWTGVGRQTVWGKGDVRVVT